MKTKLLPLGVLLLALPTMLFADIVYQGKRVQAWPEEAMPKYNNKSRVLLKTTATTTQSHFAAPKGKIHRRYSSTFRMNRLPAP